MRTFIAIEFSSTIQSHLQRQQQRIQQYLDKQRIRPSIRWIAVHNIHLTLRFLGDTNRIQKAVLSEGLTELTQDVTPFKLRLGHVGCFPNFQQPRIVWVGVAGELHKLQSFQSAIEKLAQQAGFKAESRGFSPHITIGRAQRGAGRSDLRRVGSALQSYIQRPSSQRKTDQPPTRFMVNQIVHMYSELQATGAAYTPIGVYSF